HPFFSRANSRFPKNNLTTTCNDQSSFIAHHSPAHFHNRLITHTSTDPLTMNTSNSAMASVCRPYRKFPTVNSADQIVAQPATQPTSHNGNFPAPPPAPPPEIPAPPRTCSPPAPAGRTFRKNDTSFSRSVPGAKNAASNQQTVVSATVMTNWTDTSSPPSTCAL